jgi:hypothetical protein
MKSKNNLVNGIGSLYYSTGEAGSVGISSPANEGLKEQAAAPVAAPVNVQANVQANVQEKVKEKAGTEPPVPDKKKKNYYVRFDRQLKIIREAIYNAINGQDIKQMIFGFGYDDAKLQEGLSLYNTLEAVYQQQQTMIASKEEQTQRTLEMANRAESILVEYVEIARIAFKGNKGMQSKLKVSGSREKNFSSWLEAGKLFYINALSIPEALAGFNRYSITVENLQQGQQALLETETASVQRTDLFSRAQVMTDQKVLAYKNLMEWWSPFKQNARYALKKSPQLLEQFRVVVPTRT